MTRHQLQPLFNAAYAAIFLYFARKTYRKLDPNIRRSRPRYVASLPFQNYNVIVGSSNRLCDLVAMVNEYAGKRNVVVEIIDSYRLHSVIVKDGGHTEESIRRSMLPMHPTHVAASSVSVFDDFYGFCRTTEAIQNELRAIARKHGQTPRNTIFEA